MAPSNILKIYLDEVTALSPINYKKNNELLLALDQRYNYLIDLILARPKLTRKVLKSIEKVMKEGGALGPLSERFGAKDHPPAKISKQITLAHTEAIKYLDKYDINGAAKVIKALRLHRYIYFDILSKESTKNQEITSALEEYYQLRARCLNENLSLVVKYATSYSNASRASILDLIQEGNFGLIRAIDKYDVSYSSQFSTYAVFWIRQFMLRYIKHNKRIIRLPTHIQDQIAKISKESLSDLEIAERLGISVEVAMDIRRAARMPLSLSSSLENSGATPQDYLRDPENTPDDLTHDKTIIKKLRKRIRSKLTYAEFQVMAAELEGSKLRIKNRSKLLESARKKLKQDVDLIQELRDII